MSLWLYIEDNPADADLVKLVLGEHRPEIQLAVVSDSEAALAFLRKQGTHSNAAHPDLILLDLSIPCIDGIDLLRQIRREVSTPLIVFSASEDNQTVVKCYEAGATGFVLKRSDLDALVHNLKCIADFWCKVAIPPAKNRNVHCA